MPKYSKAALSTGEAARICRISQQSMIRCVDRGDVRGFRIPGSTFRRIPREQLLSFLRSQKMETTDLFREAFSNILVITHEDQLVTELEEQLTETLGFHLMVARDAFQAGDIISSIPPSCIVVDCRNPHISPSELINRLQRRPSSNAAAIVALANDNMSQCETFLFPFDSVLLAERIKRLAPPP